MLEESFLRSMKSLFDAIDEPGRFEDKMVADILGGFVPMESALRTANDAFDPTIRNPKDVYERIAAGLPILSKDVQAKLDALGRPSTKEGSSGFGALVPGGMAKAEPKSSVDAELDRLHDLGLKNIGFVGKSMTIDSYKVPLTDDERQKYQELRGKYLQVYLDNLFKSKEYKELTDQDKIDETQSAIRDAEHDAREQMADDVVKSRMERAQNRVPRKPPKAAAVAAAP
jgi:hypothetical protein